MGGIGLNVFFDHTEKFVKVDIETMNFVKAYFKNCKWGTLSQQLTKDWILFAKENDGFLCCVHSVGIANQIVPMMFYDYKNMKLRVGLEYCECSCGWQGDIANPILPYLYETLDLENCLAIIDKLKRTIDFLNCPICNQKLNRAAVWLKTVTN